MFKILSESLLKSHQKSSPSPPLLPYRQNKAAPRFIMEPMHPADSISTFQAALTAASLKVEELSPAAALAQIAVFYLDVRADKCLLDEEGDTLLFQWGFNEQDPQPSFQLEYARHFIEPGDEDEDGMSQMSLILHYAPMPGLRVLVPGTLQCSSPTELIDFKKAILSSPPYRAVAGLTPQRTTLQWIPL